MIIKIIWGECGNRSHKKSLNQITINDETYQAISHMPLGPSLLNVVVSVNLRLEVWAKWVDTRIKSTRELPAALVLDVALLPAEVSVARRTWIGTREELGASSVWAVDSLDGTLTSWLDFMWFFKSGFKHFSSRTHDTFMLPVSGFDINCDVRAFLSLGFGHFTCTFLWNVVGLHKLSFASLEGLRLESGNLLSPFSVWKLVTVIDV